METLRYPGVVEMAKFLSCIFFSWGLEMRTHETKSLYLWILTLRTSLDQLSPQATDLHMFCEK